MGDKRDQLNWAIMPHIRATTNEDGAVLLDIEKGVCYSLNSVGARIWRTIESKKGRATAKSILDALESQFVVSHEELARDTDEYLRSLQEKGLIKAVRVS